MNENIKNSLINFGRLGFNLAHVTAYYYQSSEDIQKELGLGGKPDRLEINFVDGNSIKLHGNEAKQVFSWLKSLSRTRLEVIVNSNSDLPMEVEQ